VTYIPSRNSSNPVNVNKIAIFQKCLFPIFQPSFQDFQTDFSSKMATYGIGKRIERKSIPGSISRMNPIDVKMETMHANTNTVKPLTRK
jgi:hypothetical protein